MNEQRVEVKMFIKTLKDDKGWVGVVLSDQGYFVAQTKRVKSRKDADKEGQKLIGKMESQDDLEL